MTPLVIDPRALRRYGRRFHVTTPVRLAMHTIRTKGLRAALELKRRKDARAAGS